jgi:hypothetical protein
LGRASTFAAPLNLRAFARQETYLSDNRPTLVTQPSMHAMLGFLDRKGTDSALAAAIRDCLTHRYAKGWSKLRAGCASLRDRLYRKRPPASRRRTTGAPPPH